MAAINFFAHSAMVTANTTPVQTADERTISRYLLLLEKRPTAGTAFDRVFGYYDQTGQLDQLINRLNQPAASVEVTSARQLLLGMVYLKNKDALLAIKQLLAAKQLRTSDAAIDDQLGQAYLLQSEFDKAAAAWQSAFDGTTNRTMSLVLVKRLTSVYGKLRQAEAALDVLQTFEQRFPGESEIQILITDALIEAGRLDEATKKLQNRLTDAQDPESRLAIETQLADLLLSSGKVSQAVETYQSIASRLNPDSWQATQLDQKLQQILSELSDPSILEDYLTTRLKADPASLTKRIALMNFFGRRTRHQQSLQIASQAPQSVKSSPELIRQTITSHLALKQYEDIEAKFTQLELASTLNLEDVVRWGKIAFNRPDRTSAERTSNAVNIWNKLLTLNAQDVADWQFRITLADQLASAGLTQQALKQYSKVITQNGVSSHALIPRRTVASAKRSQQSGHRAATAGGSKFKI